MAKKMKIVNKIVTAKKMLKLYKKGYLPTAIRLTKIEKKVFGDKDELFGGIYMYRDHIGNYEETYILVPYMLDNENIKPTELIINKSKFYPINGAYDHDPRRSFDPSWDVRSLGGFYSEQDDDNDKFFSMEELESKIERKIEKKIKKQQLVKKRKR